MRGTLSRRGFLSLTAAAAAPVQAAAGDKSVVSLVTGNDRRKNIYNALLEIDDQIRPALKRKKYVLIKPNCVAVKNQLGSTHADALRGILDYLAPRFKGPVVIAESSRDDTWDAYENFHYNQVASEYRGLKVKLVDLNEEERYETFEILDRNVHMSQVRLAARLMDPGAFVLGSAILKSHDAVVATLSVKNLVMAAPLHSSRKSADKWHDKSKYHAGFRQIHMNLLLTAKKLRPFWGATVIDGYEGMEGDGPINGTPVASRLAIASADFVAADRVGVEVMGVNPEWPGYLNYCARAGLGQYDLARIELRGGVAPAAVRKTYRLHKSIDRQLEWMKPLQNRT
ncbi:MAG TPA: DUF362 domain-containing protein [Bryobacteraceae bacterium]|nr:DUF362 domain-containing protein [Bryobacteraceae bacterium]HOL72194.1 DUF362 domain-containing protein [Bryobacteraceae bacterium]